MDVYVREKEFVDKEVPSVKKHLYDKNGDLIESEFNKIFKILARVEKSYISSDSEKQGILKRIKKLFSKDDDIADTSSKIKPEELKAFVLKVASVRVNNLKNVDVEIPRDQLIILTGLSGSGKSSLAFDTVYAEGHRRFVESLSSYARMFLGQMEKPDVDYIDGLSPAISIDQKTTSKNPRSTVGTVTEIYDYLRLLYARIGTPHCPICGKEIKQQTKDQIVDKIMSLDDGERFMVLAPVVHAQKGMHERVIANAAKSGYVRIRIDGNMYDISDSIKLDKNKKHDIEIVVDRLVMKRDIRARLGDSVEIALNLADGHLLIAKTERDGRTFTEVTPLDREGRKREIARIIGGAVITEKTLASAEEMLK